MSSKFSLKGKSDVPSDGSNDSCIGCTYDECVAARDAINSTGYYQAKNEEHANSLEYELRQFGFRAEADGENVKAASK
jgi:hypothetical protein